MRTNAATFLYYINSKNFNYSGASVYSNKQLVSVYAQKNKSRVASFFNLKLLFTKPSEWSDRVSSGKVTIEYRVPNDGSIDSRIVKLLQNKRANLPTLVVKAKHLFPSGSGSSSESEKSAKTNSSSESTESEVSSEPESSDAESSSSETEVSSESVSSEAESSSSEEEVSESESSEAASSSSSATEASESTKSPEEFKNSL